METGDVVDDGEARRQPSTEVVDMTTDQTATGSDKESGLRFRLNINGL